MTIPIVSEATHLSVAGAQDMVDKIRIFAAAQGWTIVEYRTNCAWSTGWTSGTEDFLEIVSNGWAYQQLRYRFRVTAAGDVTCKAIDPNYPTYSSGSATHPVFQYSFAPNLLTVDYDSILNYPSGTFPALYIFGNRKFIAWHAQVITSGIISHFVGTWNLFKPYRTRTDLQVLMTSYANTSADDYTQLTTVPTGWQCCYGWKPNAGNGQYSTWWNGSPYGYIDSAICTGFQRDESDATPGGKLVTYKYSMALNNFSGRRPLINPVVYMKDPSDGQHFLVGRTWHSWFRFEGLQIGQTMDYQNDQYRVFPTLLSSYRWGVAYRIA